MPWVTVIIPTHKRAKLLERAVASVVAQDFEDWELIVVSDGPDAESQAAVESLQDARIRFIEAPCKNDANAARNVGVSTARGEWCAFLDDDDEWLPKKLSTCRSFILAEGVTNGIVAHQTIKRTRHNEELMPRRLPDPNEPYPDYTFRRRELLHGEGLLLAISLMAPTSIWRRMPWGIDAKVWHECDWLVRATVEAGLPWHVLMEPLAIWHADETRPRMSNRGDRSTECRKWVQRRRGLLTPEAYAACLLTVVTHETVCDGRRNQLPGILLEAVRLGHPGWRELLAFTQIACLSTGLRQRLRALWRR